MRILHVLTYVGPGNPFGGPVSVARNQRDELRRRGHEVDVIAAGPGRAERWSGDAIGVQAFSSLRWSQAAGFSGLWSPGLWWFAVRSVRRYDVVHVHLARDLVTLPVARLAGLLGVPYVVQPHGMVDESSRRSARVLDRAATRAVLRGAAAVLTLTPTEDDDIAAVLRDRTFAATRLVNGIGLADDPVELPERRRFLFCSRLQQRKRVDLFAAVACRRASDGSAAEFVVVGADEGAGDVVRRAVEASGGRLVYDGPVEADEVPAVLDAASVLVLPSEREPFPMVVVEAMGRGRAVVVTDECGLAPLIAEHGAGLVVPAGDEAALHDAVLRLEKSTDTELSSMGSRARRAVLAELSIASVVGRLTEVYESAVASQPRRRRRSR